MKEYIYLNDGTRFEVRDTVPAGYVIWNIGTNMKSGYLPFGKPYGDCRIAGDSLIAIKNPGAQLILSAVGGGQKTPAAFEKYIKRYGKNGANTWSGRQAERMRKALPFFYMVKFEI